MVLLVNPAMRTKKSLAITALSLATALAILSPSALAATQTTLNLGMGGIITNAGNQHYVVSGGILDYGILGGNEIAPESISFSVNSQVSGLNTHGSGSLSVPMGSGALTASIVINGEVAAGVFPIDITTFANCDPSTQACTSEIPAMFTGFATIHVPGQNKPIQLPIGIESPYWNPLGGMIFITSLESLTSPTLFLLVNYTSATIDWTGVQLQGMVTGTYGAGSVNGYYSLVSNSHEDLMLGTEQDSGLIAFFGMSEPLLNTHGTYSGSTSFDFTGAYDCSTMFQFPDGTCTATGATSIGNFQMVGTHGVKITGSFDTFWSVPSLTTTTSVSAILTQP